MMFCLKSAGSTIVLNPKAKNGYFVNCDRDNGEVIIDQKNGGQACYQINTLRRGWKIQRGPKCSKVMTCYVNTKKVPPSGIIGLKQGDVVSFRFSKMSPVQFKYVLYKTEPSETTEPGTNEVTPMPQTSPSKVIQSPSSFQSPSSSSTEIQNETPNTSKTIETPDQLEPMETETGAINLASTIRKLQSSISTLENRVPIIPRVDINSKNHLDDEIKDIKKQVQLKHDNFNSIQNSIHLEGCLSEVKNSKRLSVEDKSTLMKQIEQLMDNEIRLKADIKSLEESLVKEKEMYVRISRQMKDIDNQNLRLKNMLNVETNRIRGDLEPELTCIICTEPFTEAVVINCGHCYCKVCIESWVKRSQFCPSCDVLIVSQVKVEALDKIVKRWVYTTGK